MIHLDLGFSICGGGTTFNSIEIVFPTYSNVSGIEVNEIMVETNIEEIGIYQFYRSIY
jgi:hypothetical protein